MPNHRSPAPHLETTGKPPKEKLELSGAKQPASVEELRRRGKAAAWLALALVGGASIVAGANQFLVPAEVSSSVTQTVGDYIDTLSSLTHVIYGGALYGQGAEEAGQLLEAGDPLQDVANVAMERPLVIAPGWTTKAEKFDHLVAKLTQGGRNGGQAYYVRDGVFFSDQDLTQRVEHLPQDAKVFVAVYESTVDPPDKTGPQLRTDIEAIQQRLGVDRVDGVGYSLGGLAMRAYLDGGGELNHFMILGTSNHGTRFSQMTKRLIEKEMDWATELAEVDPSHLPALMWMSPESESPVLEAFNSRWQEQKSRAGRVLIVGSDGLRTPSLGGWPLAGGDGLVEAESLKMPDTEVVVLPGKGFKQHGNLPHDSDVFRTMTDFFGWQPDGE